MDMEDILSQGISPKQFDQDEVRQLWPPAKIELLGFANHLEANLSGITANQIRMAIQLADVQYRVLNP